LTEKLLLYGGAVGSRRLRDCAQKSARHHVRLDGAGKERGISNQLDCALSLITTAIASPARHAGHKDFSEDTYRVLTAVDAVVMVIDSAKGIEPQSENFLKSVRQRGVPHLTFMTMRSGR